MEISVVKSDDIILAMQCNSGVLITKMSKQDCKEG